MLTDSRDSVQDAEAGRPADPGGRTRSRGMRPPRPAVIVALALTLLAIGWVAFPRTGHGGDDKGRRLDPSEADSSVNRAGPPTSVGEPDPRETMFESGLPESVSTMPAPAQDGIEAYVAESRDFVAEVHNAANGFITGADLAQPLIDDQVRRLSDQLAGLETQAAGVDGAAPLAAAHREYAPVIEALRSRNMTPSAVASAIHVAQEKWKQAAATASPKLDRSLPPIASIPSPRPSDAPRSPVAETE